MVIWFAHLNMTRLCFQVSSPEEVDRRIKEGQALRQARDSSFLSKRERATMGLMVCYHGTSRPRRAHIRLEKKAKSGHLKHAKPKKPPTNIASLPGADTVESTARTQRIVSTLPNGLYDAHAQSLKQSRKATFPTLSLRADKLNFLVQGNCQRFKNRCSVNKPSEVLRDHALVRHIMK
jgi:hypothetical protein